MGVEGMHSFWKVSWGASRRQGGKRRAEFIPSTARYFGLASLSERSTICYLHFT